MVYWVRFLAFWQRFMDRVQIILANLRKFFAKTAKFLERFIFEVSKLKKIIATVPVAIGAVILAFYNMANLPKVVGLDLLESGAFTYQIPRGIAVFAPLAVTGVCLLLMFCSRRILTPWLVSVISLLIPVAILITNIFPA
ncbi:MAG: hypothetical protein IJA45_01315 [Oscillospiraceae bacterium]|nr:hypothetical protein [Oscillospiraceae bacterium]